MLALDISCYITSLGFSKPKKYNHEEVVMSFFYEEVDFRKSGCTLGIMMQHIDNKN